MIFTNIKTVVVGDLETNCYILEKGQQCLIIDPGCEFDKIKNHINKKVVGVLITHSHFDHIGAIDEFVNYYNIYIYDKKNLIKGMNKIGVFEFEVKYNPGHTLDSVSFLFNDIMFSGDFVFEGTIGRCDLGGDFNVMKDSIKDLLKSEINYKIFPGHGNSTTLDKERDMLNFYLK